MASCRILLGLGKIKREQDSDPFRGWKGLCAGASWCSSHQADAASLSVLYVLYGAGAARCSLGSPRGFERAVLYTGGTGPSCGQRAG